jgi:hypothetical protein
VCYHAGEHGPEDFYRRLGFHATGEYNEGETVAERILLASGDDQVAEEAQDLNGGWLPPGCGPLRLARSP